MQFKNLLTKRIALYWAMVTFAAPVIAWGLTLIFGTGVYWESARLDLETIRTSIEIREKMTRMLQEIQTMDRSNTTLWDRKIEDFNAAEKILARLERRSPRFYKITRTAPAAPMGLHFKTERATPNKLEHQPPKKNDTPKSDERPGVP